MFCRGRDRRAPLSAARWWRCSLRCAAARACAPRRAHPRGTHRPRRPRTRTSTCRPRACQCARAGGKTHRSERGRRFFRLISTRRERHGTHDEQSDDTSHVRNVKNYMETTVRREPRRARPSFVTRRRAPLAVAKRCEDHSPLVVVVLNFFERFAGEESTGQGSQVSTGLNLRRKRPIIPNNGSGPHDPRRVSQQPRQPRLQPSYTRTREEILERIGH